VCRRLEYRRLKIRLCTRRRYRIQKPANATGISLNNKRNKTPQLDLRGKTYTATRLLAVHPITVVQLAAAVRVHPLAVCAILEPSSGVLVAVAVDTRASASGAVVQPFAFVHVAVVEEIRAVAVLLVRAPFA
jgi:hypothetical protein